MTGRITPGDGVPGYELRPEGHLDNHWYDWDSGLTMHHETDGTTTLRSPGLDQAALHGVLARVRDLGAAFISVTTGRGARRSRAARRARRRTLGARRRAARSRRRSRGCRPPRRAAGSRPPGPAGAAKPESARSRARRGPRR